MSIWLTESDEVLKKTFLSLKNPADVASLLDVDYKILKYYLYILPPHKRYSVFKISKRNGAFRQISSPNRSLKIIQSKLYQVLQATYKPKSPAHGFVIGKSIVTNAEKHVKQRHVLNIDLKDFFPSINYGRIRGMFMAKPYNIPEKVATVLSQICSHDNQLPQGASTSPIISNMICAKLDSELISLARNNGCIYTRYADDITISTDKFRFPLSLAEISTSDDDCFVRLSKELQDIIVNNGFNINSSKVQLQTNNRRQLVTGLVVNSKTNVSRKYINQVRSMVHALEKYGKTAAENEFKLKYDKKYRPKGNESLAFVNVLRSKIEFIGMVKGKENSTYIYYRNKLAKQIPEQLSELDFYSPVDNTVNSKESAIVFTEGKTDWMHLKAALSSLRGFGEFCDLKIQFHEDDSDMGDDTLLKMCKLYSKKQQDQIMIFVFDRDKHNIVESVTSKETGFKSWGNNVYSLAIPVPKHRVEYPDISIEFYYTDSEIMTCESNGRRLYISCEFNEKSCRHKGLDLNCTDDKARKSIISIIDTNVFDADSKNVALCKYDFAFNILNGIAPFNKMNFTAFSDIFTIMTTITS
jgi:RNA-directed DNA polymerase